MTLKLSTKAGEIPLSIMRNLGESCEFFHRKLSILPHKCHYIKFVICCNKASAAVPFYRPIKMFLTWALKHKAKRKMKINSTTQAKVKKGKRLKTFFFSSMLKAFKIINKMEIFVLRYDTG
jgi:hypothetical protein